MDGVLAAHPRPHGRRLMTPLLEILAFAAGTTAVLRYWFGRR